MRNRSVDGFSMANSPKETIPASQAARASVAAGAPGPDGPTQTPSTTRRRPPPRGGGVADWPRGAVSHPSPPAAGPPRRPPVPTWPLATAAATRAAAHGPPPPAGGGRARGVAGADGSRATGAAPGLGPPLAREPSAFGRVMSGRAGVGGVYGLWSRARARATGTRYDADHVSDAAN